MKKIKVKEVYEKDPSGQVFAPILIRFQHAETSTKSSNIDLNSIFSSAVFQSNSAGPPPKDFDHLNRSGFDSRKLGQESASRKPIGNRKRQLVALQSDEMTYIGQNDNEEMLQTFVALRNGKKMKVYEVTPITVAPFIIGHFHIVEKEKNTDVKKTRDEKKAASIDLIKAFGSKKKRLTYERIEKNQIDVTDMNDSMAKASSQMKTPDAEPIIKDDSILTLIPPCDRNAALVQDVYNLDDIIEPHELENMDELADQFLNLSTQEIKEWHTAKKYSDYFFAMWHKLSAKKSDPKSIKTAKLVLYTELLICLLKMRHEKLRKKMPDLPDVFPRWLVDKALENFTSVNAKGVRNRSEASKDKTCCYVMVLVLLANDYAFDIQIMSTSLNVHINKLLLLAKAVGITIIKNAKDHRGVLKLPLPKPVEKRGRRRALR